MEKNKSKVDLIIAIVITIILAIILISVDAFEQFAEYSENHEDYELDELILVLLVGAFTTLWYSARRYKEVNELKLKIEELNKNLKIDNLKKEKLLLEQLKMSTMGEMLENIAHQWRQPLSTISTASTGAKLQKEMDCLSDEQLDKTLTVINDTAQYLSTTIDDFRSFFNPKDNKVKEFNISSTISKTLQLINAQFIAKDIEVIQNIEDYKIESIENGMIQVLMNILNNARDILLKKENQKKLIFINTYQDDNISYIKILDNAGGIDESIINRIFEPYFTTKHQFQGTGLGLYMSEEIVHKHLNGNLSVCNEVYTYEGIEYTGASFTIGINLDKK